MTILPLASRRGSSFFVVADVDVSADVGINMNMAWFLICRPSHLLVIVFVAYLYVLQIVGHVAPGPFCDALTLFCPGLFNVFWCKSGLNATISPGRNAK